MPDRFPIGFFDSGVGGLSVMREVRRLLPKENLLYVADSAYCPYGFRPAREIRNRAYALTEFLLSRQAKIIVVACNTASAAGLDALRQKYDVPFVGMEPAVKVAAACSRSGKVGVLATSVTISGRRFSSLIERFANGVEVLTQPCPGLVELVEAGRYKSDEARELLRQYLDPILLHGADVVILGCTHYPFLRPTIEAIVGPGVQVIDTGEAVARQVVRVLQHHKLQNLSGHPGRASFFTSGDPVKVGEVVSCLWGETVRVEKVDV
ncbi:MAG: glutamate racemase [Peptococcaceae bacterium]|nr:glutamate racemase [Peptococcaceae bacterium]